MIHDSGADDPEVEQAREEERQREEAKQELHWRRLELAQNMRDAILRGEHDALLGEAA